jgi:hypothetical protein
MNSGTGCTAKKVSQVTTQLESLDNNIDRLNDSVRTLEDKLIGCLLPLPPVQPESLKNCDELVPIAADIRRFANLVKYATEHIVDITDRLEI